MFFYLYTPRNIKVEPIEIQKINSRILNFIPKTTYLNLERKKSLKFGVESNVCWWKYLKKSCEFPPIEIKKRLRFSFFVVERAKLKFEHETTTTQKEKIKKSWRKINQSTKRQLGGLLNCYDFAYAGRDTIKQAVASGVINSAGNEINNIAQQRINQIISQGGSEVERVLPKNS